MDPEPPRRLTERLTGDGVQTVAAKSLLLPGNAGIDASAARWLAKAFDPNLDAVFVLLSDVDAVKTGQQIPLPGSDETTEVDDATLSCSIIRLADGRIPAAGNTLGWSKLGQNGLLSAVHAYRDHMPKYAPLIAAGLGNVQ